MNFFRYLKKLYPRDSLLAKTWHRFAPSFPVGKIYYGVKVYMDFRDSIDDLTRSTSELENREGVVLSAPLAVEGLVWDVGANVGLFSIRADQLKRSCVAFEQSPKACQLMRKTKERAQLSFTIVNKALTVDNQKYIPSSSAYAGNALELQSDGTEESCSFKKAAELYGTPSLIKMDIEGGEQAFFDSAEFKSWILNSQIAWLVEVHSWILGYTPEWDDVPSRTLRGSHVLYAHSNEQLELLINRMEETHDILP